MKRTLTLIRHAKSDWDHPELSDFDRPLNHRGEHDAPQMGKALKKRGIAFDLVLSSPARRAITTAREICSAIGYAEEKIEQNRDLYLASASEMIAAIHAVDDNLKQIAIVAHNPGMTMLANVLGDLAIDNMPTCSVAIFESDIGSWRELEPGSCRHVDFLYPKLFR